jgi:hypothetical protein
MGRASSAHRINEKLTPWEEVLTIVAQLVKISPTYSGTLSFATLFTSFWHWALSWARWILSTSLQATYISKVVKCKSKVVPLLNYAPLHEGVLGECRYSSTHSLTSALDGGGWSASRPGHLTPRERAPGTHPIGGCMDAVVKRKIPSPRWESNPKTTIVEPIALCHTDWAIKAFQM